MARYMVFDLETETHQVWKRKANPFYEENWVVMRGWKFQGDSRGHAEYYPKHNRTSYLRIPEDVTMLVGFNLKFDLLWEMAQGNADLRAFFKRGGRIWDCQYVEYLLGGMTQDVQMCALDDIVEKYGGRRKIDEVKILWEAGVKTSEISEQLLLDYLLGTHAEQRNSGDIGNTEKVFLGQLKTVLNLHPNMLNMIQDRMDGLLCTTEMEFRGLKVDVAAAAARLRVLTQDLDKQRTVLQQSLPSLPWEFNWNSRIQVSCLLFGGTVKYQVREPYEDASSPDGWARLRTKETHWVLNSGETTDLEPGDNSKHLYKKYKGGKKMGEYVTKQVDGWGEKKVKWQDRFHVFPRQVTPQKEWQGAETDAEVSEKYPEGRPIYSTAGEVIEEVLARNPHLTFLKAYDKLNALNKEIGTYYVTQDDKGKTKGMLTCVIPGIHMLHHKLNHTSTVTSRLSSNDPNLQNLPRVDEDKVSGEAKSEVKRMFISRWGAQGRMIEIDYSQLEVVVQGVLTMDAQLVEDLNNRVDFHCKRVAAKFHISYEDAVRWCKPKKGDNFHPEGVPEGISGPVERTKCKIFSFQRAYGAGAAKIALTTGMPIEEVEELIENEDRLYPGVVRFNEAVKDAVNATAEPFNAFCEVRNAYRVFRRGYYVAPTGTRYAFRSFHAPEYLQKRGIEQTFSPTQIKNYPTQGTGGEFVQGILGRLFRHFIEKDFYDGKAFLVNTVHDCVWFDCHESVYEEVARDAMRIMQSIPEYYNARYGMNIQVPFPVDCEVGLNMMDLEHFH